MSELSDPTLAVLTEAGQKLSESDLTTMLMRAGIYEYSPRKTGIQRENKAELIRSRLLAARAAAQDGDTGAHRGLLAFATDLVQRTVTNPQHPPHWFSELGDALLADGYELSWNGDAPRTAPLTGGTWVAIQGNIRYSILPTDAAPVPLAGEISALEAELAARGYMSVLNHYRQAVDGFTNHKYESANSDLRTALEDLVTRLAEDHTGYKRQRQASQGGPAISHMIQSGHLPDRDGGLLLRGLWHLSHTHGSHPGRSDADEARFRMGVITATARFLLKHFPERT
jgi:hypothetical protein